MRDTEFGVHDVGILGKSCLVTMALEQIVAELGWGCTTAEEMDDFPPQIDVILIPVSAPKALFRQMADCLSGSRSARIILFPQDETSLDGIGVLPPEVAAIVPPNLRSGCIKSMLSLVAEGHQVIPSTCQESLATQTDAATCGIRPGLLTDRQFEILQELAKGRSNKAIARIFDISANTVEAHVSTIIRKLNVRNRTQAALALGGTRFPAPVPMPAKPSRPTSPLRASPTGGSGRGIVSAGIGG